MGRPLEMDRLVKAVREPPVLVTVAGEAGLGKTRLIAEASSELTDEVRVLVGRCRRLRDPFPLGPLAEVIRDVGDDLAGRGLLPIAGALRPLVPEIADRLPPLPAQSEDPLVQRHQLFRGLVAVLRRLGRMALVIEDAHWADPQTLEFLGYLLDERLPEVSVVITYRPAEVDPSVPALAARAHDQVTVERIELAPWDEKAAGEMASAILGIERVSDEFAAHLCQRAAGIPLAVQELTALLVERGTVAMQDGEWVRRAIDELDVPAGVRDAVLERVAMLDEGTRQVISAAATLQMPAPATTLRRISGMSEPEFAGALERAEESGLLVETRAGLEMVHVLAAQAIYESLVPAARQALHRRAANALQVHADAPLGQIAHHLHASGQVAEWISVSQAAAEQARLAGDEDAAIDLLGAVLREADLEPDVRGEIALTLAYVARMSPNSGRVLPLLLSILETDDSLSAADRGELHIRIGDCLQNLDASGAEAHYEVAARCPDLPLTRRLGAQLSLITGTQPVDESGPKLRSVIRDVVTQIEAVDPRDVPVVLNANIVKAKVWLGWPEAPTVEDLGALQVGAHDHAFVCMMVAQSAVGSGDVALATRLLDEVERVRRATGVESIRNDVELRLDLLRGRWGDLGDRVEAFLASRLLNKSTRGDLLLIQAISELAVTGPTRSWRVSVARLWDGQRARLDVATLSWLVALLGRAGGPPPAGISQELDTWLGLLERDLVIPPMYWGLAGGTRMLVEAGQQARANALVDRFEATASQVAIPLANAVVPHARGYLLQADGDHDRAAVEFAAAADAYAQRSLPHHEALAREAVGVALLQVRPDDARQPLRDAATAFETLGARWDLARTQALARDHDLFPHTAHHRGHESYGEDLSPRERDVAGLAAQGYTNREIAEHLFLSVHTVNKHVSSALGKLNLTSRRQLRDVMPELGQQSS